MLLRRTPLSKRLTSEDIEAKLRDVVSHLELQFIKLWQSFVTVTSAKVHSKQRRVYEVPQSTSHKKTHFGHISRL